MFWYDDTSRILYAKSKVLMKWQKYVERDDMEDV